MIDDTVHRFLCMCTGDSAQGGRARTEKRACWISPRKFRFRRHFLPCPKGRFFQGKGYGGEWMVECNGFGAYVGNVGVQ